MSLTSHGCCARLKILKQAWIFSATHIITPQGLCIHRKAINKNKHPVLWRTAFQAEYRVEDYPGTPPPSVYQVTHGTVLQTAECYVMHLVIVLPPSQQSAICSIIVLTLVVPSGRIYMIYSVTLCVASLCPGL